MSRALDDLSPDFKPVAIELLARLVEAGIQVMVVDTLRTKIEHEENLRKGVSWTKHSKHLDGDAIDIVPFLQWNLHGEDKLQWDGKDPIWQRIGKIGEDLGLRWGGNFKQKDLGHFELVRKSPQTSDK